MSSYGNTNGSSSKGLSLDEISSTPLRPVCITDRINAGWHSANAEAQWYQSHFGHEIGYKYGGPSHNELDDSEAVEEVVADEVATEVAADEVVADEVVADQVVADGTRACNVMYGDGEV